MYRTYGSDWVCRISKDYDYVEGFTSSTLVENYINECPNLITLF